MNIHPLLNISRAGLVAGAKASARFIDPSLPTDRSGASRAPVSAD